ncbi:DNA-directed DNA polymerase IV KNAG_0I00510 [Huiozyma naganishii CBS 8797]|uniref:DNA polymerase n=1 Tax=Huiozyma naganishii (strain ATCC MYA-139 / BCRC 22969 / CBS 8797 / KCTC 17520 / NBRC 10181 / NCYC 3082 / Yp74L-3) TaxID=1071383 RepID=J7S252_HUIN7|nr:hypothetical protein KNAG_0I00510 [Kazachstania naganishii CBS 8797]CCK71842.1 hypothetical protein KNAG_0I00510 [Kazachstania naganishii CBS 8797]
MIFDGVKFLILPNASTAALQFITKLIEDNGGHVIERMSEVHGKILVLVNDSYVTEDYKLRDEKYFRKEFQLDYDAVWQFIFDHDLPCLNVSSVSDWIAKGELNVAHIALIDTSALENDETQENFPSSSANSEQPSPACTAEMKDTKTSHSESETDIEGFVEMSPSSNSPMPAPSVIPDPPVIKANEKYVRLTEIPRMNSQLIDAMQRLYKKYDIKGDHFRSRGYKLAKASIEKCPFQIKSGEQAQLELANIGPSIAKKIQTILASGTLPGLDDSSELDQRLEYFTNCHGIGTHTAKRWLALQYTSFTDVLRGSPQEFVSGWPSLLGWSYFEDWSRKISRTECEKHLSVVKQCLSEIDPDCQVELQGSYNRGSQTCGDIDLLFFKENCDNLVVIAEIFERLVSLLHSRGYIQCILQLTPDLFDEFKSKLKGIFDKCELPFPAKNHFGNDRHIHKYYLGVKLTKHQYRSEELLRAGQYLHLKPCDNFMSSSSKKSENPCRRLDFFCCKWSELGAARIQWTGSGEFNRWIRLRAAKMGYKLTQHGLFKGGQKLESFDEGVIFDTLDVPRIPPEEREQGLWMTKLNEKNTVA